MNVVEVTKQGRVGGQKTCTREKIEKCSVLIMTVGTTVTVILVAAV
jgi:fructose-specific phosphotransferase system component IIB